jgi:hypothetical protein
MGWKDAVARDLLGPKADLQTLPGYWIRPRKYGATIGQGLEALQSHAIKASPVFTALLQEAREKDGDVAIAAVLSGCDLQTRNQINLEMAEAEREYGPARERLMLTGGIGEHNFTDDAGTLAAIDDEFVEIMRSNRGVLAEILSIVGAWNPPFVRTGKSKSETQRSGSSKEQS